MKETEEVDLLQLLIKVIKAILSNLKLLVIAFLAGTLQVLHSTN